MSLFLNKIWAVTHVNPPDHKVAISDTPDKQERKKNRLNNWLIFLKLRFGKNKTMETRKYFLYVNTCCQVLHYREEGLMDICWHRTGTLVPGVKGHGVSLQTCTNFSNTTNLHIECITGALFSSLHFAFVYFGIKSLWQILCNVL